MTFTDNFSGKFLSRAKISLAKCFLAFFLATQLASCSGDLHQEIIASDDGKFILKILNAAKLDDGASLKPLLNQEVQKDPKTVKGMTDAIRKLAAGDIKLESFFSVKDKYSSNVFWSTEVKALFLRQPKNTDGYIVDFIIQRDGDARVLSRVRIYQQENMSVLSFMSQIRSIPAQFILHPGFAVLALLSFSLTIAGVLVAVFGKDMNHRWVWAVLSFLGIGVFTASSTETGWGYDFLSFTVPPVMLSGYKLFAFGFFLTFSGSPPIEITPMGLYFSIPLGAIITLAVWDDRRRARRTQ